MSVEPKDVLASIYGRDQAGNSQIMAKALGNDEVFIDWGLVHSILSSVESDPSSVGFARILDTARKSR